MYEIRTQKYLNKIQVNHRTNRLVYDTRSLRKEVYNAILEGKTLTQLKELVPASKASQKDVIILRICATIYKDFSRMPVTPITQNLAEQQTPTTSQPTINLVIPAEQTTYNLNLKNKLNIEADNIGIEITIDDQIKNLLTPLMVTDETVPERIGEFRYDRYKIKNLLATTLSANGRQYRDSISNLIFSKTLLTEKKLIVIVTDANQSKRIQQELKSFVEVVVKSCYQIANVSSNDMSFNLTVNNLTVNKRGE